MTVTYKSISDLDQGKLGTVYLKDWIKRGGKSYLSIHGLVSIASDEQMFGFRVKGTETNWAIKVSNPDDTFIVYVLGCQIRAIELGDLEDIDEALVVYGREELEVFD